MHRLSNTPRAWGYLLPLDDGLPAFELRLEDSAVGTDESCALWLSPNVLGLASSTVPRYLFRVLRSPDSKRASLHSECAMVQVNGVAVDHGLQVPLELGSRIVVGLAGTTYMFLERSATESLSLPAEMKEKYLVGQCLGKGSFGKVYLLFDKKSQYQRRALKIINASDESERKYATREAEIMLSLIHPCVTVVYDVEYLDKKQFLVMEFLGGGDLSQFVNNKHLLSETETKLLFFQLALAVSYLHEKNICHRDLKPANILLQRRDPRTLIKVTDFGLAKDENIHSSLKTQAGTEAYLAPEIIPEDEESPIHYTHSVDIWSMGVVLFYSLTGTLPFPYGWKQAVHLNYRITYQPERWSGVSNDARELVQHMLRVTAAQRPSASEVLGNPWLQDDCMREDAYQLTRLESIRPLPKSSAVVSAPAATPVAAAVAAPSQRSYRTGSGPRGVLEYYRKSSIIYASRPPV